MHDVASPSDKAHAPYFGALDGVRAWCILLVIYNHVKSNGYLPSWINGHLGVDIFFILSGFLITTLLAREQTIEGRVDLRSFYWRRCFRIAPVYLVAIAIYLTATHMPGQHEKWVELRAGLPYFLTMMNEFAREPHGGTVFTHSWSLGIEEKFYLLWPLLAFTVLRAARARILLLGAMFVALAFFALLHYTFLTRAYCGLLMGCLLSVLLSSAAAQSVTAFVRSTRASVAIGLLLGGFYLEHLQKDLFIFFSIFAAFFLSHLVLVPSWLADLHQLAAVQWLGRRSYAMYLVHILCLNVAESHLHATSTARACLIFLEATALSAAAAELLFRLVEQPARRAGRSWLARRTA